MDNPFDLIQGQLHKIQALLEKLVAQENIPQIQNDALGDIQLAESITKLKRATIYSHVSKKKIPFIKKNGKLYFSKRELEDWIKGNQPLGVIQKPFFPYHKQLKKVI